MPLAEPTTALIVDDHPFVRRGIADFLSRQGFAVTEAGDVATAWAIAQHQPPHVVILDIIFPRAPGTTAAEAPAPGLQLGKQLKSTHPTLGLIFFSSHMHFTADVYALLRDGYRGVAYKSKTTPPTELLAVIQEVLLGGIHVDPAILTDPHPLLDEIRAHFTPEEAEWIERVALKLDQAGLTAREAEIAGRVAAARTIRRIAEELHLAPSTVESHIHRLYEKLGLQQLAAQDVGLRPDVILAKACTLRDLQKRPRQ